MQKESVDQVIHSLVSHAQSKEKEIITISSAESSEQKKFGWLYGDSIAMHKVFRLIRCVAPSDAAVMVIGPTGCGKELVAHTIHDKSTCAQGPFLPINCGALPENLIESELFGYEKGAFTGANKTHPGFFERAHNGTLFLDEITETPLDFQVKLLRVLETGRFIRIGGTQEIKTKVRILTATNRDPLHAVEQGSFRQDLFYRLAVFPITVPALHDRDHDIMLLANHFLQTLNLQYSTAKYFAKDVEEKLCQYHWPGNVRELKNWIYRAYILSTDKVVNAEQLTEFSKKVGKNNSDPDTVEFAIGSCLEDVERAFILATLDRYHGDKQQAARVLGISLKTIYNRLNRY